MERGGAADADWTCSGVCHPSESLTAGIQELFREKLQQFPAGKKPSRWSDRWCSADSDLAVILCRPYHVEERQTHEFHNWLKESFPGPPDGSRTLKPRAPIVLPDPPLFIEELQTATKMVAFDAEHIETSYAGTLVELLVEKTSRDLEWLVGRNLILSPVKNHCSEC